MRLLRSEAEDFLYSEAHLLDQRRYDDWVKLFTPDGIYWLPMEDGSDPELVPSVLYDDMHLLRMRVHQYSKRHYSQRPPSRTIRAISNVTVVDGDADNDVLVRCVAVVTELREGDYLQRGLGEQRVFSGHCEYRLLVGEGISIAIRKILLLNRESPIVNLSFIL
jgi:3-phenylpropionate/cinnamic acid dioxygenase small subunit